MLALVSQIIATFEPLKIEIYKSLNKITQLLTLNQSKMKKLYFALAALVMGATAFAQDYYVIGDNVNGASWALADENAKMSPVEGQDNVYSVTIETLGTGFKINDGTWEKEHPNFGSNGEAILLDTPYEYTTGDTSGNIAFDGFTAVKNAVVTLDLNAATITVSGEAEGAVKWYFVSDRIAEGWTVAEGGLEMEGDDTEISCVANLIESDASKPAFKISNTGWGKQYGHGEFSADAINADCLSTELAEVGSEDAMPIDLVGAYLVTFNFETSTVTFAPAAGVADVAVDANVAPVYYNLQGVRVNNLVEGNVYIAKRGNEAIKFVK